MTTCIYETSDGYCGLHSGSEVQETCIEGPCGNEVPWVSLHETRKIIAGRERKGLFWTIDNGRCIGIDNTDGNAWTEEFETPEACRRWLEKEGEA